MNTLKDKTNSSTLYENRGGGGDGSSCPESERNEINVMFTPRAMKINDSCYVVTVPSPFGKMDKEIFGEGRDFLENFLKSNIFLIILDLKNPFCAEAKRAKIIEMLQVFFENIRVNVDWRDKIFIIARKENNKEDAFINIVENILPYQLNSSLFERRINLYYVCDHFECAEGFIGGKYENLEKSVFNSNFIYVCDEEESKEEGKKGEEGEEEIYSRDYNDEEPNEQVKTENEGEGEEGGENAKISEEKFEIIVPHSSTPPPFPSNANKYDNDYESSFKDEDVYHNYNKTVPKIMRSFIKFAQMFRNKGLNFPKLYVLDGPVELDSYFVDFFGDPANYFASFPTTLFRSNVIGFCLGEDGRFSKKINTFHLDDFVIFPKNDFENLRIDVFDENEKMKCTIGEIDLLSLGSENEIILEYKKEPKENYYKRKAKEYEFEDNFIRNMHKQWVGELYLINNGDSRVVDKGLDLIFNIYSRLLTNVRKDRVEIHTKNHILKNNVLTAKVSFIKKKVFSVIVTGRKWEDDIAFIRKQKAKRLICNQFEENLFYDDGLALLRKMTNLKGKIL